MLKGNLSTRPFYNERLATLAIAAFATLAAALTVFNGTELLRLSSERRASLARSARDQNEATRIRTETATLQKSVDRALLTRLAGATREANDIIDQRTFSWTGFFGLIEKTLPMDVRVIMVSPRVDNDAFKVAIDVVAKTLTDVSGFVDALRGTGAFYDVAPVDQAGRDDGTIRATVEASYLAPAVETPATDRAAPAAASAQPERKP